MSPLLSMLSLMVLGMETRLVAPLRFFFFLGFSRSAYLVVDLDLCFLWLVATEEPPVVVLPPLPIFVVPVRVDIILKIDWF